jgi:hypothetical protein
MQCPAGLQPQLRCQALDWVRANFVLRKKQAETDCGLSRVQMQIVFSTWQNNAGLTSVRDKEGLAMLPALERKVRQQLWADVEALRQHARQVRKRWFAHADRDRSWAQARSLPGADPFLRRQVLYFPLGSVERAWPSDQTDVAHRTPSSSAKRRGNAHE